MLRAIAFPTTTVTNSPAFSAYLISNYGLAGGVETKVTLNGIDFNVGGHYSASNYRFTPPIAGFYQVNVSGRATGSGVSSMWFNIRKNGTNVLRMVESNAGGLTILGSAMIYLNGTDYIEYWGQVSSTSGASFDTAGNTVGLFGPRMSAFLVLAE